jgi:hypothetical protein
MVRPTHAHDTVCHRREVSPDQLKGHDMNRFLTRAIVVLSLLTPLALPSITVAQEAQDELITIKSDRQSDQNIFTLLFGTTKG